MLCKFRNSVWTQGALRYGKSTTSGAMVAIQLLNLAFAGNPAKVQQVNVVYLLFLYASSPSPSPCSVQSLRSACSDQACKRCRAEAGTADPADPDRRRIDKQ